MKPQADGKHPAGLSPSELAERAVYRRAVEALIWGMPAVNYELMSTREPKAVRKACNESWNR